MSEPKSKQLLICQNDGCQEEFVDTINEDLEGDAASLPSALKAHKAGWLLVDGRIYCPRCAQQNGKFEPDSPVKH